MSNDYPNAISNRYEFVLLYDVENGNPNGDPDAGNMPRVDPETGCGIVTDVCIKRKIRNYVDMRYPDKFGFDIYVREGAVLNRNDLTAGEALGICDELKSIQQAKDNKAAKRIGSDLKKKHKNCEVALRNSMCEKFYDIRSFGAVMTTFVKGALNCGQVRGPIQLAFGKSIDPIFPQVITVTRVAITTEDDALKKETEMGSKQIVPYGLYKQEGYISANLARTVTGFSEADLEVFWDAVIHMFDDDRSAARGKMALRELIIFKHGSPLGNAPAHKLFERVKVARAGAGAGAGASAGIGAGAGAAPRKYEDYTVSVDKTNMPDGVHCDRRVL